MRILRVAQKLYPDVKGGGPYHVHAMSRDQAAMGHDVTVLTVGDGPPREDRDGYTVVRKPAIASPLGNAISPHAAWYLNRSDQFDVVHAHSHLYFSTNLAALECRFDSVPLAITNHGLFSQTAPEWIFDAYLRTAGRWTFNQADVVLCYTDADRRRLRDRGVHADIEVVPNGIDTGRFTLDGPESDLVEHDGPVVLFVGRLVEGKRPGDAVRAVAELRASPSGQDAALYLCGEGPLRDELRALARELGVGEAVTFLGHVPYDEMPAVYRSGDVFMLPSRAEGAPRTVLEARASGLPTVTSDLRQVTTSIDAAGLTAPVGDIRGFARALERALENGTTWRDDRYDWMHTVERTTEILSTIAERPNLNDGEKSPRAADSL